jgi:hypothetical protein
MYSRTAAARFRRAGMVALLVALQISPGLALAALASHDLAGVPRVVPTTLGALEASTGLSPPLGVSLTIERL